MAEEKKEKKKPKPAPRAPEQERQHAEKERHKSMNNGTSNDHFAKTSTKFQAACDKAGVQPTSRQASKYRRGFGAAWAARNQ